MRTDSNNKPEEVRAEETRLSITSPHALLAGATIDVHKSPFWFPAKVVQVSSDSILFSILLYSQAFKLIPI